MTLVGSDTLGVQTGDLSLPIARRPRGTVATSEVVATGLSGFASRTAEIPCSPALLSKCSKKTETHQRSKLMNKMLRLLSAAMMLSFLTACGGQIVNIKSDPPGADVYSNRDLIGKTPLLTSKDEIMPLWSSDGVFTRACITLRKPGFNDYKVFVNELTMPSLIEATLVPIQTESQSQK